MISLVSCICPQLFLSPRGILCLPYRHSKEELVGICRSAQIQETEEGNQPTTDLEAGGMVKADRFLNSLQAGMAGMSKENGRPKTPIL